MADSPTRRRYLPDPVEAVGVAAMLLLVVASTLEGGTPLQRALFLVAPVVLFGVAYASDELMLAALEVVVVLGAVLGFFPGLSLPVRLGVLGGSALLAVAYLVSIDYLGEDRYWPVGGAGLVVLAVGVSLSGTPPLAFNALLVAGSALLAVYSVFGLFVLGVRIQAIWLVLNVAFGVAPTLRLLHLIGMF